MAVTLDSAQTGLGGGGTVDTAGIHAAIAETAASIAALNTNLGTINQRITALENTSTTPPSPPTVSSAPTLAFTGGSADVGDTATITPTVWSSGTVLSRLFQMKTNGEFTGPQFSGLTFTVPSISSPRGLSIVETANFGTFQLTAESAVSTVNVSDASLAEAIISKSQNWWAFEDTGANTGLTAHRGQVVLSVGNGKNASNMSTTGGNQGRMGRFATTSPHDDVFFISIADDGGDDGPFEWGDTDYSMGAWIAPRQSITGNTNHFLFGRTSFHVRWHGADGASEQGFELVARQADNTVVTVRPATYFTPSGGLALQHVAAAHSATDNKIYLWVNGVQSEAAFTGGIETDDTSLFSVGNLLDAAEEVIDNATSMAFDIDDLFTLNAVLTDDEATLLSTAGTGIDALAVLADVDLTPVSGGGSGGGTTPPDPPPTGTRDFTFSPFPTTAFVNTLIPTTAIEASDSDPRTVAIRSTSTISTTYEEFSVPIYRAVASSPIRSFNVQFSTQTIDVGTGIQVPIPVGAEPDEGRNYTRYSGPGNLGAWEARDSAGNVNHSFDGIITVISADGLYAHELYHAYIDHTNGQYRAWSYARIPLQTHSGTALKGPGCQALYGTYRDPTILGYGGITTHASGFSSMFGKIRGGEITNTTLWPNGPEHKLLMLLPVNIMYFNGNWSDPTENRNWIRPAVAPEAQGHAGGAIKVGQVFRIRKGVNLAAQGLSTSAGLQLGKCLQRYGCILSDNHGINHTRFHADREGANADGVALAAASADMIILKNLLTAVDGA